MKILSHRGYWKNAEEKNTKAAFRRSFRLGFGTETDLRDDRGRIVISHDPAVGAEMLLEDFLALHREEGGELPLALNIKADGLQSELRRVLDGFPGLDFFCFDMSIPDALHFPKCGLAFFTRQSEVEREVVLYDDAAGVWMDMFYGEWVGEEDVLCHLENGKRVCLVSPDLHKRPHEDFWSKMKGWSCVEHPSLMLCTDFPEEARSVFYGA